MESEVKITDLLSILEKQNKAETDLELVGRRRAEINNVLQILKLSDGDEEAVKHCKDRLKRLVSFPKEAGQTDVAMDREWQGRKDWDDEEKLTRFYSDED